MRAHAESTTATRNPDDRLLKVSEAAGLLSVSVRMVHRLVATGDLNKIKLGKAARFRLSDIEALMQKGAT